jgi:hypothetical protein
MFLMSKDAGRVLRKSELDEVADAILLDIVRHRRRYVVKIIEIYGAREIVSENGISAIEYLADKMQQVDKAQVVIVDSPSTELKDRYFANLNYFLRTSQEAA